MVQVIDRGPSFGSQLAQALGQAGVNVVQGLEQGRAKTALDKILNPQPTQNSQGQPVVQDQVNQTAQPAKSGPSFGNLPQIYDLAVKGYGKDTAEKLFQSQAEKLKLEGKEEAKIRAEERALATAGVSKFFENIETDRGKIDAEEFANSQIAEAVKSGDIDPWSSPHLAEIGKGFGIDESLLKALENVGSKEYKTAAKTFIGSIIKDSFKGTTNKTEITLAQDTIAELGVSPEANLASIAGIQAGIDIKREKIRLTDQLREQGVTPSKIPAAVDKMLNSYRKELHDEYFDYIKELRDQYKGKK